LETGREKKTGEGPKPREIMLRFKQLGKEEGDQQMEGKSKKKCYYSVGNAVVGETTRMLLVPLSCRKGSIGRKIVHQGKRGGNHKKKGKASTKTF